ncbi:MAG: DUF429 domain-containing protein [Bryobacterales bacterium]|nr:DUF429 domain-containing protein [Bryobacterales bacterium]
MAHPEVEVRRATMQFLGVDFGWTSQPSGIAAMAWRGSALELTESGTIHDASAVADWAIERLGDGPGLVAIDAPTIIRNETGMRPCEREMHRRFGRYHAGCYPANLGSPFASRTQALSGALLEAGIAHAAEIAPQVPGRFQIEVFPHAASIHLFSLTRIVRYKKGTVAQRRAGLLQFQFLLCECLATREPRVMPFQLARSRKQQRILKAHEDRLDAILCAYIGAWWWYWGAQRTCVLGDLNSGFIVVPVEAAGATGSA